MNHINDMLNRIGPNQADVNESIIFLENIFSS